MTLLNLTKDPKVVAFRKKLLFAQYSQKRCETSYCPLTGPIPPRPPRFRRLPSKYDDEDDDDSLSPVHENVLFEFIRERRKELEESPNYQELLLEQEKRTRELREYKLKYGRRPVQMMKKNGDEAELEKVKIDETTKVDGDGPPLPKCKLNQDVNEIKALKPCDAQNASHSKAADVDLNLMGVLKPCVAQNASHSKAVDVDLNLTEMFKPCDAQNASLSKAD